MTPSNHGFSGFFKQAGNGPSRRHILGSKIALQSVKVFSSTVPENPKSWSELGTLSHFLASIVAKHQKRKRDPLVKKIQKVSQCQKN